MSSIYKNQSKSVKERVSDLLGQMTLEEKVAQLSCVIISENTQNELENGIGTLSFLNSSMTGDTEKDREQIRQLQKYLVEETRLGIPALIHNEGIAGLQIAKATTFQQPIGLASTWEPELAREMGELEQEQLLSFGMHALHSPLFDLGRDPRWGRISETYGEDPYLVAQMGTEFVKGLQKDDKIMATAKHFLGYGNAQGGKNGGELELGERTLRDTYCWPFEAAVQDAGVMAVMNGYGILNGEPIATSRRLLTDLLRGDLGFDGAVVSDYGSIGRADARYRTSKDHKDTAIQALKAGIDVEQPTNISFKHLVEAVQNNEIEEFYVDQAVERLLTIKFRLGLFENPYAVGDYEKLVQDKAAKALSQEISEKSIVLLKNEDKILPLEIVSKQKIALVGPSADAKIPFFGGYSSVGSAGSSTRDFDQTENDSFLAMAYQASITEFKDNLKLVGIEFEDQPSPEQKAQIMALLKQQLSRNDTAYSSSEDFLEKFYPDCKSVKDALEDVFSPEQIIYAAGCGLREPIDNGIEEAVKASQEADVVIAVVGGLESMIDEQATCGENRDNTNTDLEQNQLDLLNAVFATGKPVIVVVVDGRPLSLESVSRQSKALLHSWLPAEKGGEAIANVLTGKVNPSGKLPVTMVKSVSQIPMTYSRAQLYVDDSTWAEYIDTEMNRPLYPFGHGLSYTEFRYQNLVFDKTVPSDGTLKLSFEVTNIGKVAGDEIAQVYIQDLLSSVARPSLQLVAFQKVSLEPGQTKRISVSIDMSQLAFHDLEMNLVVEAGEMAIRVGASSENIHLKERFTITGETTSVAKRSHKAQTAVNDL